MTNPLTPRLEQIRALVETLGGAPLADLRQILTALEAVSFNTSEGLSVAQSTQLLLDDALQSIGAPGEPANNFPWLRALWQEASQQRALLALALAQQAETNAALLAAFTGEGSVSNYLASLDNGLAQYGSAINNNVARLSTIELYLDQMRSDLAALRACLCESTTPTFPFPFPAGECELLGQRARLIPSGLIQGTNPESNVRIGFTFSPGDGDFASGAMSEAPAQDNPFEPATWIAWRNTLDGPRDSCIVWAKDPGSPVVSLTLHRTSLPVGSGGPTWQELVTGTTTVISAGLPQGSYQYVIPDPGPGITDDYWYALSLDAPPGTDVSAVLQTITAWVTFGAAG